MTSVSDADARELLAGRLVDSVAQAMEAFGVYLGVELGMYRALAEHGPATETDLAGHAGVAARYAREWLEQQAVAGYLTPARIRPNRPHVVASACPLHTPTCSSTATVPTSWHP